MKKQTSEITIIMGKQAKINGINYTSADGITKNLYSLIYDYCDAIASGNIVSTVTMYTVSVNKDSQEIVVRPDVLDIKRHKWIKHLPTYVYIIMYNYYRSKADDKLASKLQEKQKEEMLKPTENAILPLLEKIDEYHVAIRDMLGDIKVFIPVENGMLDHTIKDLASDDVFLKVVNGAITGDFAKVGIAPDHRKTLRELLDKKECEYISTGTVKPIEQIDADIAHAVGNVFKDWSIKKNVFYVDYVSPNINKGGIKSIVYTISCVYVKPTKKDKNGIFKRQRDTKLELFQRETAVQYLLYLERKVNKDSEPLPVLEPEKQEVKVVKKTTKKATKKTAPAKKTTKKAGITKNKETGKLEVVANK